MSDDEMAAETPDAAIRAYLFAIGFTLVLIGGEMMAEKDNPRFYTGLALIILGFPVHLSWVFWKKVKPWLGKSQLAEVSVVANSPRWWLGALFILLFLIILSPFVERRQWPFTSRYPHDDQPSSDDVAKFTTPYIEQRNSALDSLQTITKERDAALKQMHDLQERLQSALNEMTRVKNATERHAQTQQSIAAPIDQTADQIAWQNELTSWTSNDQSGLLFLGIGMKGKANAAAELTNAYIASEITGERKILQISLAPGPQLAPISDINQIPPNAPIELWAVFTPPVHASDLLAQWGRFHFHAEYSGFTYDVIFDEETMNRFLRQFPNSNVGPHITKKSTQPN